MSGGAGRGKATHKSPSRFRPARWAGFEQAQLCNLHGGSAGQLSSNVMARRKVIAQVPIVPQDARLLLDALSHRLAEARDNASRLPTSARKDIYTVAAIEIKRHRAST